MDPTGAKHLHVDEDYGVHKHLETLIYRRTEQHCHRNGVVCISYNLQTVWSQLVNSKLAVVVYVRVCYGLMTRTWCETPWWCVFCCSNVLNHKIDVLSIMSLYSLNLSEPSYALNVLINHPVIYQHCNIWCTIPTGFIKSYKYIIIIVI